MKIWEFSGENGQQLNSDPALRNPVVTAMRAEAPIFEHLEFYPVVGNADSPAKDTEEVAGNEREIDEDYTGVNTTTDYASISLKICGDKAKTDLAKIRRGQDLAKERERKMIKVAKSVARSFTDKVFNNVASKRKFHGIKSLIPSGQTFVNGNLTPGGSGNGAQLLLGNDNAAKMAQQKFFEQVDKTIAYVQGGPSILAMNADLIARMTAIKSELVTFTSVQNAVGQTVNLVAYRNIPIVDPGFTNDLSGLIIPNNETCGSSTDCTSLYALKFGEEADLTAATNVGVQVLDLGLVGVQYVTLIDFDVDIALLNDRAVARLKGIRL
ncbi:MAG: major capsid protein [Bacteroidota bacterium]